MVNQYVADASLLSSTQLAYYHNSRLTQFSSRSTFATALWGNCLMASSESPQPSNPSPHSNSDRQRSLRKYCNTEYHSGRGLFMRLTWYFISLLLLESSWLIANRPKRWVLKLFGAKIGKGLVIHPNVRIKYPWKLSVGDDCWIGREVWIDNLDEVTLESDVCLSQQAYLCTGSHDHYSPTFELKTGPIVIEHGAWICCRATVLGHSRVPRLAVVPANTVFSNHKADRP